MASQNPFPLIAPKSTELRLLHFDENAYTADPSTILYKFVDALAGSTGAGALVNEYFLARMGGALETIYFNELDFIFSKINFMARSPAESYTYNPLVDMLTANQWNEVRTKDAWYRARIKDFFKATTLGGTPDGIRQCVEAAVGVDCDVYEAWRYLDNYGLLGDLGRSPHPARNEVAIRPHKSSLSPGEMRLLRDMLDKVVPVDTIVTVNLSGLAVANPVPVRAAAADSSYFEVQRMITATPVLATLPAPELLSIDLLPTEQWLFLALSDAQLAPYSAFNISAEFGYFYLTGGGRRSPIDSVSYGTLQPDGSVKSENNYSVFLTTQQYTPRQPYPLADSPDNYPEGKFGRFPNPPAALATIPGAVFPSPTNPDGTPYRFAWSSQSEFVTSEIARIVALGGQADFGGFRLPIQTSASSAKIFFPEYGISYFPPARESTVTMAPTRRRGAQSRSAPELRDPSNFVRT